MPNAMTVQVADLIRAGLSTRRAAARLNVTVSQIANWRARAVRHKLIPPMRQQHAKKPLPKPAVVKPGRGVTDPGNGCRYIAGEPHKALYCGQPKRPRSSFCPDHHARP